MTENNQSAASSVVFAACRKCSTWFKWWLI